MAEQQIRTVQGWRELTKLVEQTPGLSELTKAARDATDVYREVEAGRLAKTDPLVVAVTNFHRALREFNFRLHFSQLTDDVT